jgi:hypothetical protein
MDSKGDSEQSNLFPDQDVLRRLAISESGFIFDPSSGHHFTVNSTGLELLRLLLNEQRLDLILNQLRDKYDAPIRDIERDVVEFASTLREYIEN